MSEHLAYPVHRISAINLVLQYAPKTRKRAADPSKRHKPIRIPLNEYTNLTLNLGNIIRASEEAGWMGPHGGVMFQGCEFVPK